MDYELWDNFFPARLHTTKEIIYFLENIHSLKDILNLFPKDITNIIFGDIYHKDVHPLMDNFYNIKDFKTFNNINIEITSRKVLLFNNIPINYHYSTVAASTFKNNILNKKNIKENASNLSVINNCVYHELSDYEIEQDLKHINELIKSIFNNTSILNVITQINLKLKTTNNYIPERDNLVQGLKRVTNNLGINCYDIGNYIETNYDHKFMSDYVLDNQHFNSILKYEKAIKIFNHKRPCRNTTRQKLCNYNLV